ncbi:MAG: peptidoglycan DD-metalloendopeptidase family protein [Pelagibacteraceae bacterium]|jgi:murein DD-endopeptidase MepM/ murein hydrolase activator NlpD|nr:peptidoglycan DD-metalloendopeptidase family protein [Pelagibacteraceae bacterium]MBO6489480.1 peptidoglycan DD-metalloendopeptidase family protein [Pelagibacteraceae bacterium]
MTYSIQPNIYVKLKKSLYAIISLILISFIFFTIKYNETSSQRREETLGRILKNNYFLELNKFIFQKINSPYLNISHKIKKGENLTNIFKGYNIDEKDITKANSKLKKFIKPNKLKMGIILDLVIKKNISGTINLIKLNLPTSKSINVSLDRDINDKFIAKKKITQLFTKLSFSEGIIEKSLYSSAIKNNVDPNIILEFARLYGFEIDFQRDIRKNDAFQILYETFTDEDGEWYSNGKIIYAYMTIQNRELALYKYEADKLFGYFDINGKSMEKALMKTPINGARLSSSFGLRKHPILGFNKKHLGTDFAAPPGTPIMASGTGTIVKAQWCGGGGNCIKIKHNSTYSTVYAHLMKFASGIKSKTKVKQGQIIGYVGSTGLSTGPHLHYEVIVNGKKINSQKLNLPSGKILKGEDRKKFEIERIKIDVLLAETIAKKN